MFKRVTLGSKLLIGGITLVLAPVAIVGFFSIINATKSIETSSRRELSTVADTLSNLIHIAFEEEMRVVEELSYSNTVIDGATKVSKEGEKNAVTEIGNINRRLSNTLKQVGKLYETVVVADTSGNIYADGMNGASKGISIADGDYFTAAKSGKANVGQVSKSKMTGNPIIPIAAPIRSQSGDIVGVMAIILKLDFLTEIMGSRKIGETGYPYVVDKDGIFVQHPRKELVLTDSIKNHSGMANITEKVLAHQKGVESYVFEGVKKTAAFAPESINGWSVVATQENGEFLSPVRSMRNGTVIIGIILAAVSAILVLAVSRGVSKPILSAVSGLNEASSQVTTASTQVSFASQQLAEGASEQASALEETSSALEEMSSMTKQNADNAKQANQLMAEASGVVERANRSMIDLTSSMEAISRASEETRKIIKTIDEIAFQTNLLALNAAVEAARAGEVGAGFAVVADEVRNLAMRASDAAKNTAALIQETVTQVKQGSAIAVKTNEEFQNVSATVSKSGELVGEITAASQEQAQGIDQINRAVSEMDRVVQQNAASAEESAAASEQMHAQAEMMKGFVSGLVALIGGSGKRVKNGDKTAVSQSRRTTRKISHPSEYITPSPAGTKGRKVNGIANGNGYCRQEGSSKDVSSPEEMIPFDDEIEGF